ncbi:hypothetical protein JCM8202_004914 [Rhodotorula sphaerocarpa]
MASPRAVAVAIIFASSPPPPASAPPPRTAAPTTHDSPTDTRARGTRANNGDEEQEPTFLLVSSRKKKNRYVFPKGGIEWGERPPAAAERESWEEAGLRPGTAKHLAHLLTLKDPSAHILSPTDDVNAASFVASCQYSFELFYLAPPPSSDSNRIPDAAAPATPSSEAQAASPPSKNARIPPSAADPPPIPTSLLPSAYTSAYLAPVWPESHERDRVLVRGWEALDQAVCWGRREGVMREALLEARRWIEERRASRLPMDAQENDDEDDDDDEAGERGEATRRPDEAR